MSGRPLLLLVGSEVHAPSAWHDRASRRAGDDATCNELRMHCFALQFAARVHNVFHAVAQSRAVDRCSEPTQIAIKSL
jgi:hypothetical protein